MAKLDTIFRRANRLAQNMKNGAINVLGANQNNHTIARYFSDGRSSAVTPDAMKKYDFYQKARKKVFGRGGQYKQGSTGSKGG